MSGQFVQRLRMMSKINGWQACVFELLNGTQRTFHAVGMREASSENKRCLVTSNQCARVVRCNFVIFRDVGVHAYTQVVATRERHVRFVAYSVFLHCLHHHTTFV